MVQRLRPPQEPGLQAPVRWSVAKSVRRALVLPAAEAKLAELSLVLRSKEQGRAQGAALLAGGLGPAFARQLGAEAAERALAPLAKEQEAGMAPARRPTARAS